MIDRLQYNRAPDSEQINIICVSLRIPHTISVCVNRKQFFTHWQLSTQKHSPHNSTSWEYALVMKPGCSELITSRSRSFRGIQVVPAFDYSFILSHNFGCRYIAMGFCTVLEKKFSFKFSLIMEQISFQTYDLEIWMSAVFTTCWISIKKTFPSFTIFTLWQIHHSQFGIFYIFTATHCPHRTW